MQLLLLLLLRLWFLPQRIPFLLGGAAFVVLLFTTSTSLSCQVVTASSDQVDDQESSSASSFLTCPIGFGGDPTLHVVSASQVNDGYCDCPTTGQDEPLTNACAGREYWAGLGIFDVSNEQLKEISFPCPQQPPKVLSLSKLNDGICDCCCGSDEPSGNCGDICDEVLAQERAERLRLQTSYKGGSEKRKEAVSSLEARRQEVAQQLEEKQRTLVSEVNENLAGAVEALQKWKVRYLYFRKHQLETRVSKVAPVLFDPLSTQELLWWIIHACQLAGEMAVNKSGDNINTCLPLRLAALDHGILWRHVSYQLVRVANAPPPDSSSTDDDNATATTTLMSQDERETIQLAADLLHANIRSSDKGKGGPIVYNEHGLHQLNEKTTNDRADTYRAHSRRKRRRRKEDNDDDDDDDIFSSSGDEDKEENYDYGADDDDDDEIDSGTYHKRKDKDEEDELVSADGEDDPKQQQTADKKKKNNTKAASKKGLREVLSRRFSLSRNSFLEESGKLMGRMDAILDEMNKKEEEEGRLKSEKLLKKAKEKRKRRKEKDLDEVDDLDDDTPDTDSLPSVTQEEVEVSADGSTTSGESNVTTIPSFDPVSLPIARDKLVSLKSSVQRGIQYAVSAKMLLDILVESHGVDLTVGDNEAQLRSDLYKLAVGTIAHGKLSSIHVWQLYHYVVEDLAILRDAATAAADVQTCQSPWASPCPPLTVRRTVAGSETEAMIPQGPILKAANEFCAQQAELAASGAASSTCLATSATVGEDQIPSDIPDGFMGYYSITPREEPDSINQAVDVFDVRLKDEKRKELEELVAEEKRLKSLTKKFQREMKELRDSVGSDDPDKYGIDGELFALKDQCFKYDAGKYEYEVCLFGSAKQREGKGGVGGTDLGKWTEPSVDEFTSQRMWHWSNGLRCWQGPSRSTTAYVTCGEVTRILSVEEPEICKYELRMESYVACDENFRRENGLQ